MTTLPSQAQIVVIGGGIVGCSVAYHLAGLGFCDVVVIERAKLTSGSTWHAAGLAGQLRTSANVTRLLEDSVELYDRLERGRVTGLTTTLGPIGCEKVVNCGGQWARHIGGLAGVNVPLVSVQHQYIITEPIVGVPRNLPTLRDPDRLIYFKEEVGGLVMGGYEPNPLPWAENGIPDGFEFQLLPENWDHFEPMMVQAMARVPTLATAGIKQLVNGPESFTPDGNFILGEAPEVAGFFVGAGFNAFGIASAGGAGRALAEWVAAGEPPMDLWPVDIRRFGGPHQSTDWVRNRTLEAYSKHYTMAWPFEEYRSGRPLRTSPLYPTLMEQGACFGEKMGWERSNWFAPPGVEPEDHYSYGRQNWFVHAAREHRACRENVALFDESSFAKFEIAGPAWAVKLRGEIPFLGRDALRRQGESLPKKVLCCFSVADPSVVLLGRETIYRDDMRVGWLTSGGFGHTVGMNIGYGYVRAVDGVTDAMLDRGRYELEVAAARMPCTLHRQPLCDPTSQRVRS